jgi:hypothetical protein
MSDIQPAPEQPAVYGPYGTEQQTYNSPLARAVQAAEPGRGVSAQLNQDHLASALADARVTLGSYDVRILNWLIRFEPSTVQVVIGLISRAYAAGLNADSAAVARARDLATRWADDRTAFPDGAAPVLEEIAELLSGGERS